MMIKFRSRIRNNAVNFSLKNVWIVLLFCLVVCTKEYFGKCPSHFFNTSTTNSPPPLKIQALLERTGYTLDVTTGQRKYGGPPPDTVYSGSQPGIGTEVGLLNEHLESCYLR